MRPFVFKTPPVHASWRQAAEDRDIELVVPVERSAEKWVRLNPTENNRSHGRDEINPPK